MRIIPDSIQMLLRDSGYSLIHAVAWVVCDRKLDGGFAETYLVLDTANLYILTPEELGASPTTLERTFTGFVNARKKRWSKEPEQSREPQQIEAMHLEIVPVERIESLTIVNLVASGMIVVKDGQERSVAAVTNGRMADAAKFASAFDKLKKGEAIDVEHEDTAHDKSSCPKCGMIYPEEGRPICPKCMKKHALLGRVLKFAAPYKGTIALIIIFMLLNSATGLIIPYLQGTILFDQALGNQGTFAGQIGLVIALIVLFRTLSLLFGVCFGTLNAKMSANVAFDLKASVFSSMQRLSLQFFQKKQTGQLMTRVNSDATELQYFFTDGISYFIVNVMNIVGITVVMFVMNWKLTLMCFLPLPLVFVIIRYVFPGLWRMAWQRHRRFSTMNAIISDTMRGSRVVKAFGKENREIERFGRASESYAMTERAFNRGLGTVLPLLSILMQAGGVIVWAYGGWKVVQGEFTFGQIMTFVQYIFLLYGPLLFMNHIIGWWSNCMSAAQRIFEIQDTVPDIVEKTDAVSLERIEGSIEVNSITFGYEPNKPILSGVSMQAEPGQMIGVVGHSGAGKSTLVNLISRLYDVTEGEIRIDGINVKDLSGESLRSNIGIVSQEVYVFIGTIAENIAYAKPECTMEEIILAARIAKAHDFIESLTDGYDTIVGTGGYTLSGGEKQRISIARAILHDPRILILDEATASLDTETELQIQEALESLIRGRTTIAIAHRLSTLRNADYLLVMDGGKVVEAGTHGELMDKEGVYFGLVRKHNEALQMRGVG